ncbi:hypothetical protein GOBAR_DD01387 [Gossypium barbadense]|nr:hypothetical protein GOBAR_DD01387 [Gossypium barbadense]
MELVDDEDVEIMVKNVEFQDLCTVVLRAYIDRRLTVRDIDIDLNAPPASENLNLDLHLQIDLVVIETYADGDDVYDNNGFSDHEVEDYSDLDQDEVLDDIDDEGVNDDENVDASSVGNPNRGIMIRNDPGAHMSIIDLDVVHASEFLEYLDILPAYRLGTNSKHKELFVGQKFATKEDCICH